MHNRSISAAEVAAAYELSRHLMALAAEETAALENEAAQIMCELGAKDVPTAKRSKARVLKLSDIEARCDVVGDCWLWKQGTNSEGVPQARTRGKSVLVRREVAFLSNKVQPPKGYFVVSECQDRLCVAPKCVRVLAPWEYVRWLNDTGRLNTPAQAAAKAASAARRSALTNEAAREVHDQIRAGADRGEVAESHGISRSWANRIAAGAGRNVVARGASIFNL
jgi:hypothetical protein